MPVTHGQPCQQAESKSYGKSDQEGNGRIVLVDQRHDYGWNQCYAEKHQEDAENTLDDQ